MADVQSDDAKQPDEASPKEESPEKTLVMDTSPDSSDVRNSSVEDVLEHLDATSALLDTVDGNTELLQPELVANIRAEKSAATQPASSAIAQELSIEQYMAELLERSNGRGTASAPDKTVSRPSRVSTGEGRATVVLPPSQSPDCKRPATEPKEPYVQKRAPECRNTISDLRELANMNARTALDAHCGQRLILQMHNKLIVALVSIVVSFAMIGLASSIKSPAYFGAIAALIASIAWSMMYLSLGRQLGKLFLTPPAAEKPSADSTAH